MTGSLRLWLCVVVFVRAQRNPRLATWGRSFHPGYAAFFAIITSKGTANTEVQDSAAPVGDATKPRPEPPLHGHLVASVN